MFFKQALLSAIYILLAINLFAQENLDAELRSNRSRLNEIKTEINQLKNQLDKAKKDATSVQEQIKLLDKKIALTAQAKGLMQREQRILERRSANNHIKLKDTKEKLIKLKKLFADRLVYMYKYGKIKNLELLLTSESFNQAFVRYRYLKMIAEYDEKTIREITAQQEKIAAIQKQLNDDIDAKNRSIREKQQEERNYKDNLATKNSLLNTIQKNQTYYKNQIALKQQEQKKLTSLITSLEQSRKNREKGIKQEEEFVTIDFDNFNKGKGKLPWPVYGKIISTFGKQYDPVSKTSVNNSGIEISSKLGTPVKCVFTGVVRLITYMGGYGNTVIIDHGRGYYTVYSHLGEIYVRKNDVVETNQIIAQVGDSGSLSGSKLHFEIYGGNQPFNPQSWLRK